MTTSTPAEVSGSRTGSPGTERWLVAEFAPVSLFSLKTSQATSSVGRTLLVPTPYAIKMACVDAAFRAGWTKADCAAFLESLVGVSIRIGPPSVAVVTHTIIKIRQEPKSPSAEAPYTSNIAYREMVHHQGIWRWAFHLADSSPLVLPLERALAHVRYVGKRGSFLQFLGTQWADDLGPGFTQAADGPGGFAVPAAWHVQPLDDYGPAATFSTLSTYSGQRATRGRDRVFVSTIIPLGVVSSGPGFSEYRA